VNHHDRVGEHAIAHGATPSRSSSARRVEDQLVDRILTVVFFELKPSATEEGLRTGPDVVNRETFASTRKCLNPRRASALQVVEHAGEKPMRQTLTMKRRLDVKTGDRPRRRIRVELETIRELREAIADSALAPSDRVAVDVEKVSVIVAVREEIFTKSLVLIGCALSPPVPGGGPPRDTETPPGPILFAVHAIEVDVTRRIQSADLDLHRDASSTEC